MSRPAVERRTGAGDLATKLARYFRYRRRLYVVARRFIGKHGTRAHPKVIAAQARACGKRARILHDIERSIFDLIREDMPFH